MVSSGYDFVKRHPILWIMALSLTIKLLLLSFDHVINTDGVLYIAAARHMAEGNFAASISVYRMPAFPLLLSAVHWVIPDWIAAAQAIGTASLVLATIPLYGITHLLFSREAALWAALCLAVTPEANEQAMSILRDPVFILLALTAIYCFIRGVRETKLKFIVLSLALTGGAFLFRVEGFVLFLAPVLFLSIKALLARNTAFKPFARKALAIWIGIPLVMGILISLVYGPKLLRQNRVGELAKEIRQVARWQAFDNYHRIYGFFKTIESDPPFSGFSKSLPAIVRHWMPLIYLIGLLEYFIKQFYPIFLVPLLWSVQHYFSRRPRTLQIEKQYVLLVWGLYILLILYAFMVRDFIQGRFLFTPAVLLYPWVGHGCALIVPWLKRRRYAPVLQAAVLIVLIAPPVVKSVQAVATSDRGALAVGRFISTSQELSGARMLFSDPRYWLYSGGHDNFRKIKKTAQALSGHIEKGQWRAIEAHARKHQADALVLFIGSDNLKVPPEFEDYSIFKRIPSRKGIGIIYRSKNLGF